jgi:hypothetical protein
MQRIKNGWITLIGRSSRELNEFLTELKNELSKEAVD